MNICSTYLSFFSLFFLCIFFIYPLQPTSSRNHDLKWSESGYAVMRHGVGNIYRNKHVARKTNPASGDSDQQDKKHQVISSFK